MRPRVHRRQLRERYHTFTSAICGQKPKFFRLVSIALGKGPFKRSSEVTSNIGLIYLKLRRPPWSIFSSSIDIVFSLADCADPTCGGHGFCVDGSCVCRQGWTGPDCSQTDHEARQCLPDCSGHGEFDLETQQCRCRGQWTGKDCSKGKSTRPLENLCRLAA